MPQQRLPMRKIRELWLAHAHIIPIVSTRAPPNTCPFPRFRSLEVFRRRPLAVWDVCDGRHLKTFTDADSCSAASITVRCRGALEEKRKLEQIPLNPSHTRRVRRNLHIRAV